MLILGYMDIKKVRYQKKKVRYQKEKVRWARRFFIKAEGPFFLRMSELPPDEI